jgi:hypothetical protein
MQQLGFKKDENFFIERKIKKNDVIDNTFTVSLSDLFRRIPELQNVIEEYIGKCSLVLNFGLDSFGEHEDERKRIEKYSEETGEFQFRAPPITEKDVLTHVSIFPSSENMTIEYIENLHTPFTNFKIKKDSFSNDDHIICDFLHKNEGLWWNSIKHYKSDYCPTSYIVPLFNQVNDPIVINYLLMYSLSIIVRYMPDIWYEITQGSLDNIGNLIDYYISIFDHVIPLLMLERITDKNIHIVMPSGFNAPV